MAIFAPLGIGRTALLAHERALQTTGHNIANVNTPGYSRQRTVLSAIVPGRDLIGRGVSVGGVEQTIDPFLEARRLQSQATLGGATTSRDLLDRLQSIFPVQDATGIGGALQEFFAAVTTLSTHPEDLAVRAQVLGRAESLAGALRGAAADVATLQREADDRLVQHVSQANGAITEIAALNRDIVAAEAGGGTANDLRDARRVALGRLAETLDIRTVENADGAVDVFTTSGATLVLGADAGTLGTEPGAVGLDGRPLTVVGPTTPAGGVIPLGAALGGTLGVLVTLRDQTVPATAANLDLLAVTLRDAVNAVQTDPAGRDLDGVVGQPLFAGADAANLTVALTDPRALAAARSTNPGDNANALALAAVGSATFGALGGASLSEFFGGIQADAGEQARRAADRATVAETLVQSLEAQRDAISGVSLEEEFTDLIRFQRGFQAATQLINVSNALLDDLLGMVGT